MALLCTRIFALLTLLSYLVVGSLAVRVFTAKTTQISFSLEYFSLLTANQLATSALSEIEVPEQRFAEIRFPQEAAPVVAKAAKIAAPVTPAILKHFQVTSTSLPFQEPVVLKKIEMANQLPSNLLALYRPVPAEVVEMVAKSDTISTQMAKVVAVDDEPTFLDYSTEEVQAAPARVPEVVEVTAEADLRTAVDKGRGAVEQGRGAVEQGRGAVDNIANNTTEEVAIDDLITYDYSSINTPHVDNPGVTVASVTTQAPQVKLVEKAAPAPAPKVQQPKIPELPNEGQTVDTYQSGFMEEENAHGFLAQPKPGFPSEVTIHATGFDLKKLSDLNGFEVRFQDDLSAAQEDYGSGAVMLREMLAQPKMTRSIALLKRGFAPTNTDLIVEEGVSELILPMLDEEKFNQLLASYETRGPVGMVLVELDDETEEAQLDVPFGKVITLDGDLKATTKEDYRYQLFVGVKAGNALLSYKGFKGETISKVIHVHEHELTFEANLYEKVKTETLSMFEEDLLAREHAPLIIGSQQVKKFATNIEAKKISDHNYKLPWSQGLLANRRYVELSHQSEPVFLGVRDVNKVIIPSENFMRFVLSRFEGAKLGNRCLVQVNLSKKVARVDVGSESVADSLMTYTQMLDSDGKFYDSAGEKTRKVIVVGENQGAAEYSQDAKINLKVTYEDETVQYLSSYCSPNTYLVEQL